MMHLYKSRSYRDNTVTLLCNGEKIDAPPGSRVACTVPTNVTCPKCLDILIPREEAKLNKMKASRQAPEATP